MRIVLLLSFALLSILPCYTLASTLIDNQYTITASTLTYNAEQSRIFLRKNVRIVNRAFIITAQEVDVLLEQEKGVGANFSSESIKEILLRNTVTFSYKKEEHAEPINGKGDSARYEVVKEMVYLYGNAVVETEGNIVKGDSISIHLPTYAVRVEGSVKKPVELIVRPTKGE